MSEVRDGVMKVVELKQMSTEEASKAIEIYVSRNPGSHYVSDLSEALGIELGLALRAVKKLMKEGLVKPRRN